MSPMFNKSTFKSKLSASAGGAQSILPAAIQSLYNLSPENDSFNSATAAQLQKKLDEVSLADAQKFKTPIGYLCEECAEIAYTHVKTCTGSVSAGNQAVHGLSNGWIKYTSSKFEAKATVYVIAGSKSKVELGFGQYCTAKNHSATYADGTQVRQCMTGHPDPGTPVGSSGFPVGDSSQDNDFPFYYRGVSHACTDPCWESLKGRVDVDRKFEMNDYFNNNGLPAHWPENVGSPIGSLARRQSFTIWLIRRLSDGTNERVLQECKYTIGLDIAVTWANDIATCAIVDASSANAFSAKQAGYARGMVAVKTMNSAEQMAWCPANGAWQV
jgi:hypothetical protein